MEHILHATIKEEEKYSNVCALQEYSTLINFLLKAVLIVPANLHH